MQLAFHRFSREKSSHFELPVTGVYYLTRCLAQGLWRFFWAQSEPGAARKPRLSENHTIHQKSGKSMMKTNKNQSWHTISEMCKEVSHIYPLMLRNLRSHHFDIYIYSERNEIRPMSFCWPPIQGRAAWYHQRHWPAEGHETPCHFRNSPRDPKFLGRVLPGKLALGRWLSFGSRGAVGGSM